MIELDLKKGSYNRLWIVLSVLAFKDGHATLQELADLTGMPRSSTEDVLKKVVGGQVPELVLVREKASFTVEDWGLFLTKESLLKYYNKYCNNG
jgi:hypothetical protein